MAASMVFALAGCSSNAPAATDSVTTDSTATDSVTTSSEAGTDSTAVDATVEQMVTGTITDAAMNTIVIKTADGVALTFSTESADKTEASGLLIDSTVIIYYTGTITGEDTTKAVVTRLVQDAATAVDSAAVER